LFIQRPSAIEKSNTPVCDFIYRDKSGAKFYTALSQKQRQILWDYLGPAKYHLQGISYYYIHHITKNIYRNINPRTGNFQTYSIRRDLGLSKGVKFDSLLQPVLEKIMLKVENF
jgi:hypothetical protein